MYAMNQTKNDLISLCNSMSDATIAGLTGYIRKTQIDYIRDLFVLYVTKFSRRGWTWQSAWERFIKSTPMITADSVYNLCIYIGDDHANQRRNEIDTRWSDYSWGQRPERV